MRIIILCISLLLLFSFGISVLPITTYGEEVKFILAQGEESWIIYPVERSQSVTSFYDYYSLSGHTPFMQSHVSKIYLYNNSLTGALSLVIHHGRDDDMPNTDMEEKFNFEGIPTGVYVSLSDEPQGTGTSTRSPYVAEFNLTLEPEALWEHAHNSDGGVLSGLPINHGWAITIHPNFTKGIDAWKYVMANETEINLDMNQAITIAYPYLTMPWDLTGPIKWVPDWKCDIRDVALVALLFGSEEGDGRYDARVDITGPYYLVKDGKIDIRDVALVALHFGEEYT